MLRKSLVAVTLSLLTVGGVHAGEGNQPGALMKWIQGPSIGRPHVKKTKKPTTGIRLAVISDAERQAPEIRQTSSLPQVQSLQPAVSAPKPTPATFTQVDSRVALAPLFDTPSSQTVPAQTVSGSKFAPAPAPAPVPDPNMMSAPAPSMYGYPMTAGPAASGSYPVQMSAGSAGPGSLYPAPRPGIPHQVGGTIIPTQALHPHEMLYPHRYKSMYGPYYYKVRGHWMVTPFGVWSKENWKLKGTTVDVKYKSHISPFAMFHRPVIR